MDLCADEPFNRFWAMTVIGRAIDSDDRRRPITGGDLWNAPRS